MLAIIDAYRAGLLKAKNWWPNLLAGSIVGIVALPLAMAFAIASGVKPEQGLYTAIIAGICVALFGGSRVQIAGPTGAFVVILASITAQYGVIGLQIATLLAGFILILMGLTKLGNVIKFIPDPVIVGFTSGIGFIIFVGEWKDFFGLPVHFSLDAHFHQKFLALLHAFPHLNLTTTMLACLSLVLMLVTPKVLKRIPGPLVAMVVVTALQYWFNFPGVATLGSTFGQISKVLPNLHFPTADNINIVNLIGPAFTIALLGAIESLLSATVADSMTGGKHNSNQELIGQGLANILAPLFGGFAATGAIARTATNIRNGGNSPIAAIIHSILLIAVIVMLAPLASYIPLCALAAILFVVAYNMSDIPHFISMLKHAPRYDVLVLSTTFLMTIFTDLVVAVNVGVILSMLLFVCNMHQSVAIELQNHDELINKLAPKGIMKIPPNTSIYSIKGPFFFGVAEKIERELTESQLEHELIIFRLRGVPFMDITGLETFSDLVKDYYKRGKKVYLCEANSKVKNKLINIGIMGYLAEERIFNTLIEVLRAHHNNDISVPTTNSIAHNLVTDDAGMALK